MVAAIGGTVFLFGVVLIFLPGPSILVIPVGLGILATEFIWARQLLKVLRKKIDDFRGKPPKT
jgi:tellurite resistance protein TerC